MTQLVSVSRTSCVEALLGSDAQTADRSAWTHRTTAVILRMVTLIVVVSASGLLS